MLQVTVRAHEAARQRGYQSEIGNINSEAVNIDVGAAIDRAREKRVSHP